MARKHGYKCSGHVDQWNRTPITHQQQLAWRRIRRDSFADHTYAPSARPARPGSGRAPRPRLLDTHNWACANNRRTNISNNSDASRADVSATGAMDERVGLLMRKVSKGCGFESRVACTFFLCWRSDRVLLATETRHLDRLGQLGEFEQESNTDSHSARSQCAKPATVGPLSQAPRAQPLGPPRTQVLDTACCKAQIGYQGWAHTNAPSQAQTGATTQSSRSCSD